MKKVLAIILAICMLAVFVPAFAVSAAENETVPTKDEAVAGKERLTPYKSGSSNVADFAGFEVGAGIGSCACGFIDGNVYFDRLSLKTLGSGLTNDEILVYVDGKPADLATSAHAGYRPNWDVVGGGFQIGIINATLKKDVPSTVTLVFGNTGFFTEFEVVPNASSISCDSSEVVIKGAKATITLTGKAVSEAYKAGETVKVQLHDDHNDRTFTVASVTGETVVMTCDDFKSTSKTMLEIGKGTDKAITVNVDSNAPGGKLSSPTTDGDVFNVFYQTRTGTLAGQDMRFIFAVKKADLSANDFSLYANGQMKITFKKGDAVVASYTESIQKLSLFDEVVANGEYWTPAKGDVLTGFILKDVPVFAWTSISLSITNGEDVIYASTMEKDIKEQVAMGGFVWLNGEQNAHAGVGANNTSGETNANNLFDKDAYKYGFHSGANTTQTFTWNYADAKTVSLYGITTGNDSSGGNLVRNPKKWVFFGSNDEGEEKTWVEIDKVDTPNLPGEGGQTAFYTVNNPTAYKFYKIEMEINTNTYFQLGEIRLYETASEVEYNFNDIITGIVSFSSNPNASYPDREGLAQLFDNDAGSKFGYYSSSNQVTIEWSYAQAQTATGYGITTGGDSTRFSRNPKGWTLYGSNDKNEWTELDKVTAGGNFSAELNIYGIDNPTPYQHYKIVFETGTGAFQMADIALYN